MEIWKPIDISKGVYEVSNEGRVRRVYRDPRTVKKNGSPYRYLKPRLHKGNRTDYFDVTIWTEDVHKTFLVHRLVAETFIPNPKNLAQVNHKNGNGKDNRVENLEWVTNRENALHAKANGFTRPGKEAVPIRCVELNKRFGSSFEAADFINHTKYQDSHRIKALASNIRLCVKNMRPTAYGYHWEYC